MFTAAGWNALERGVAKIIEAKRQELRMANRDTTRREFLQLAHTYKPAKHKIVGWWVSEKLDGMRCFWDGGITRGMRTVDVPWAGLYYGSNHKKDGVCVEGQLKEKIKPIATGLWSRAGNPIVSAPDWFLDKLPVGIPLDGELWAGRNKFQLTMSICSGDDPDPRFDQICYAVYGAPTYGAVFQSGVIKTPQMWRTLDWNEISAFIEARSGGKSGLLDKPQAFETEYACLQRILTDPQVFVHEQICIGDEHSKAYYLNVLESQLQKALDAGGEGLIIRDPKAVWIPKRHNGILKYKPFEDSEATVVGYTAGKQGAKGNVLGKIGALIVLWEHKGTTVKFEIASGLTFDDRLFANDAMWEHACDHPGEDMPRTFQGASLKVGDTITFKYRELTEEGIPREARFYRVRPEE
jgi:DNA ligase-1